MAEKRILIADADPNAWEEFRMALGDAWIVVGVATGSAAMAEAQKQPFDVVVAHHHLPELEGAELLNRLRMANSKCLRFIAAAESMREEVMCHVLGGHQFISIPFDRGILKGLIERSVAADYGMSASMRELVSRIRTFPTIPSLYVEVVNALKDPNATTEDIGAIISKDMAMTTKLVQVLNSAYFGLPRTITDPTEAVGILGFETVKSLIMTVKLLSQYDKVKPVYFSIDNIWRHSTNVARTAKVIALLETGDTECSGTAYTAGLMHDLGKVILAANFDSQYNGAHNVARKQQMPLWEVEKDIFGASHGEIGAYLLGLWGMTPEVVNVAALHHHPMRAGDTAFTPLTAVHVANALEYEGVPDIDGLVAPVVDPDYIQQLGLAERIELWRDAKSEPDATRFESRLQRAKSTAKAATTSVSPAPKPVPALPPEKFAPAPSKHSNVWTAVWQWLALGASVTAVIALLAWLEIMRLQAGADKPELKEAVAKLPPPPTKKEVAAAPASAKPEEKPKATPPVVASNPSPLVAVHPITAVTSAPVPPPSAPVAVQAPVKPVKAKTALDGLKLEAIFFSSQHPSALINGQLAGVDEQIANCRVLDIGPSSVTLEYQNQRRTLSLR